MPIPKTNLSYTSSPISLSHFNRADLSAFGEENPMPAPSMLGIFAPELNRQTCIFHRSRHPDSRFSSSVAGFLL
ncbi:hypothetical protein C4D60_Mb05t26940 [Musa balbisiana]|uniref:Uncharacterized protein n=1 Tax=Musa balbisiana TaxID=52838 RepID=A0A4S8JZ72_MUSBA|nr:hypothetical protein C4D60_Mb05t26940 [Musa balbisiana]